MQHYLDNSGAGHHSMNVGGQSNNTISSTASHYVFGGGSSQATSTLQPLPNTSSLLSGASGNQHVVGNNQHTNNGQSSTTSIQIQLQQLQQYQQQRYGTNNTTQQLPSMNAYPSQQNQEDDQLADWMNEQPSRMLQQQELPPFENDFGFDGWFQSEENLNNVLSQQLTNGYFQNSMMGNLNNQGAQDMDNYQSRQMGLGSNFNLNSVSGNLMQNGQPNFVMDDPNFNVWGDAGDLDLDEGLLNKHQGNPLFGGTQLFTNHTMSTTESKGVTSITALANSLNFSESPQMKKTRKSKKTNNLTEHYQQNGFDESYEQNILDMDNESFKNYVNGLYGEKGKKKNKTQIPFNEEDFSKLLLAKERITELYHQCQQDNMSLVNSVMSQYTPSMEMDDSLSNEMKELYAKVNAKLDYKNTENKNHCEQVLKKLIYEWVDMVKAQKTVVSSDKTSNDSSNKSSKKSKSANRRLPNEAKKVLENWFLEHYKHPYPTNEEKQWLSDQTQLNLTQINNWFINKRGRSLKLVKEKLRTETDDGEEE
ncbi:homeodomain-containing protein [Naegleria gruberi]|uniref:Homeodomain-containing protein n=1 Tax=Naegleria gruberi TaxID=5762 RepID=D2V8R5_NAEGR|nr:homeodomain-containing protein [Naegleria gruberi]EFC46735.1 homeodomain-containing protein [Naegleria gruberi]|eukprot:XP_002679479.1 homeodomain-containing protein [Naegleria gruberi strain NEG-M]